LAKERPCNIAVASAILAEATCGINVDAAVMKSPLQFLKTAPDAPVPVSKLYAASTFSLTIDDLVLCHVSLVSNEHDFTFAELAVIPLIEFMHCDISGTSSPCDNFLRIHQIYQAATATILGIMIES
jgi:hypothetical protein